MAEISPSFAAPEAAANPDPALLKTPTQKVARSGSSEAEDTRPGKKRKLMPPLMTAAAAQEEIRNQTKPTPPSTETSPNPAVQALNALLGNQPEMSRATGPQTPNPATTVSAPMAEVAANLTQTPGAPADTNTAAEGITQTSPVSMSSLATLESLPGPSGMTTTVGSPLPMDETARHASAGGDVSMSPEDGNKAFTFPPPLLQPGSDAARRGMSLPGSNTRQGTRSPSSKKHKCPYCATEFTRHHNLKSHLLTHSQEKPYVCSTCQSRFRRLHDLKRHTKLHTGERNHICPKCGRKFARGDALARHNKGPGGCAGRRASIDSFGGDDDMEGGDESMDMTMYGEPEAMDEDGNGMPGPPSIRRQAPSGDDTFDDPDHGNRLPSTYPPIQGRPPGGIASGSYGRHGGYGATGTNSSGSGPSNPSLGFQAPGSGSGTSRHGGPGGIFAQNPLTESPKPLSPGVSQRNSLGGPSDRNRSPSMSQFPQPSSYPRSGAGSGSSSLNVNVSASSTLPPPMPDPRFTLASQGTPTHPPTQPTGPPNHMASGPLSSHSNSLSSHGLSGHGSGEAYPDKDRLWAVIKNLENRVNSMQGEIDSLRSQLAVATGQQPRTN
ncbi:Transcriptional regulator CRZ1 [Cyphellophora attinorum]|uniref:Transcriptional regulator CRZ1 n=1 Tax=Cyphellophora attinorum TaxID=1664694 RepID=A0A0N1P3P6_9EURO|nr:Transcriptional regulator CRZ1 [Phialophora attinorum]KPI45812.1 Transcriptional regulator CRZ1 [Phialophora attinorum]